MNVVQILKMFYKHLVLICGSMLVVVVIVFTRSLFFTTPKYTASAQLIANNNTSMISTYKELITSEKFREATSSELKRSDISADNANVPVQFNVIYTPTSPIFSISCTSTSPKVAAASANIAANLFVNNLGKYFSGNLVSIYSKASIPNDATKSGLKKRLVISLIAGFILGTVLSLIKEIFARTLRDSDYTENVLGLNNLGVIHLSKMNK
ncbi:YveK family protein [Lactiplantibacillus daoliensis]|uniref:Capsular polysaccharide biosynthesis protein CpsC n=1 Tax=Lactiplantibacillus daoliensis TaxID=2559916 RepID=A0ABW1UDN9_9LACO|nr:Wzz/FepE/Etk N-terminal domain-containing protein [Lactiplantibacillus daoliensis]